MRLRILSDLHLEFADWTPPRVDADVVVIAGDLHRGTRGVLWLERHFPEVPVVYVAGNHEFYGETWQEVLRSLPLVTQLSNVRFLENAAVELGDVVFLGSTLWTDFKLLGDASVAGPYAASHMNDYRQIRTAPHYRRLKGLETAAAHARSKAWLATELERYRGRKIVVVTHHAPSEQSLEPRFRSDPVCPAYASALDDFVSGSGATLWIHGHTHRSVDYYLGATRVVANQRGYPEQTEIGFQPDAVLEI